MRVLVADPLADTGLQALAAHFDLDVRTGLTKAELLDIIGDYDAVVVRSQTTLDADVLGAAGKLKVIARAGIGLDNVDVEAATTRGVLVCNAPQSNVISAAEHTVALLLAVCRNIPQADRSLRAGEWRRSDFEGAELHGKTLGILGLGRVGTLVAQRCSAFGMRLVAYDPYVTADRAARMGVELVPTVGEVCRLADVLTVHLPKTPETVGIIGEDELRSMKPTARVVNTARGGLIDESALHTALVEGWIAAGAIDVFATEPPGPLQLFELDNIVVTPHLGASTSEAQDKAGTMAAEAVIAALRGDFVASAVNIQVAADIPEGLRPFMGLAEQLGRVLTALQRGPAGELVIECVGRIAAEDPQPLTLSALKGVLTDVVHEPVTFVNAPLLAEERGLKVSTVTSPASEDYVSLVRLRAGDARVAGTVAGPKDKPRLVEVWGYDIDMEPSDHMVFFRYVDRPGIVGLIGGKLGEADVNIATMQVGRREMGGEAVIAMAVDSAIPPAVLQDITVAIGATEARTVDLSPGMAP
jgi:D-3-phosphoglycerate dehydrogenase / 2-oxoglutarate reductase